MFLFVTSPSKRKTLAKLLIILHDHAKRRSRPKYMFSKGKCYMIGNSLLWKVQFRWCDVISRVTWGLKVQLKYIMYFTAEGRVSHQSSFLKNFRHLIFNANVSKGFDSKPFLKLCNKLVEIFHLFWQKKFVMLHHWCIYNKYSKTVLHQYSVSV